MEATIQVRGHGDISNSQSLANKVCRIPQDSIKILQDLLDGDFCGIDVFLVIGISADGRTEPGSETGEDFGVCEGAPLHYLCVCFEVFGDEGRVGVLFGN